MNDTNKHISIIKKTFQFDKSFSCIFSKKRCQLQSYHSWPRYGPMGTGTIQVLIYGHMGTGTIWVSFRSVSVVCWLIGDLTIWFVGCDPHPVFLDICFISVNEQFWTRTPFFCRCEVRNLKLRIRVIDPELLGDLTFWFVCGCDSHPVFCIPPTRSCP